MKLSTAPYSSSSRRVTMTLLHLGLSAEQNLIDLRNPSHRAALTALNPNSKIPVLEDGDFVLWESHAIMQYLCGQAAAQTLYPSEPRARADVDRWTYWNAAHLSPVVGTISFERLWKKVVTGGDPDPKIVERYEAMFRQSAGILDRHLQDRSWISGSAVTLADFSIASTLMYARPARLPIEPYQHLVAYLGRIASLDAWKQTEPPPMAW
ncbi:MAG: glutathione S-transferase family protein [Myxococcales bacterium]|nr:glutathione S-transferase family protein [Myxococcales bacterium]